MSQTFVPCPGKSLLNGLFVDYEYKANDPHLLLEEIMIKVHEYVWLR